MAWKIIDQKNEKYQEWLRFVHPYKQESVVKAVEKAEQYPGVVRIILFGSSVTGLCHGGSDVDLYVVEDSDRRYYVPPLDDVYDIITPSGLTPNSPLVQSILKEGFIIYERKAVL